jgi:hypothetical protein
MSKSVLHELVEISFEQGRLFFVAGFAVKFRGDSIGKDVNENNLTLFPSSKLAS